jgi:hypothetical protein
MRFKVEMENPDSGEVKQIVVAIDCDDQALLIAQCMALRQAYRQVDPDKFNHTAPPEPVYLS